MTRPPAVARPGDNPFSSSMVDSLGFRSRGSDMDEILADLSRHNGRGAVVGPHGSGKTTLIDEIAGRVGGRVTRVRLGTETATPAASAILGLPITLDGGDSILLDGAEQLGFWGWRRFLHRTRQAAVIVITSHQPGRLPTICECSTNPELLADLVRELSPETAGRVDLDDLFHRHNGNIRMCFRELYDLHAGRLQGG